MATVFRPAGLLVLAGGGTVGVVARVVGLATPPVVVVAFPAVGGGVVVVSMVEYTGVDDSSDGAEVLDSSTEEADEAADEAAVEVGPVGTLKVTPAERQRAEASRMVASYSAGVQAPWTHGAREARKLEAEQIHWMSVIGHPVPDKPAIAQESAHCGMFGS